MNTTPLNITIANYSKYAIQTKKEMSTIQLPIDFDNVHNDQVLIDTQKHLGFVLDNIHQAMGIVGEYHELTLAKNNNDIINLREESGDICWFVAVGCEDNGLSFNDIVENALETLESENKFNDLGFDSFGFCEYIKKCMIYKDGVMDDMGKIAFKQNLVDYYTNIMRMVINETYWRAESGFDIETILTINIEKLRTRYGKKFTEVRAISRNLVLEREVLENK